MTAIDALIDRQLKRWELESRSSEEKPIPEPPSHPVVTISRQTGSRGAYFAELLGERLGYQMLHREVVEAICASSGYRRRIVESLDQRFRGELELMVEAYFSGQTVDYSDYNRHLIQTVLSMSRLGGVVLLGRGGNFIVGPDRAFRMRFVGPKEVRVENLKQYRGLGAKEAAELIQKQDAERKALVHRLFKADIDDPLHYDMIVNVARLDIAKLLEGTITAIRNKFELLRR
jgi:cytidylate kinase